MGVGIEPATSQVAGSIAEVSMLNVGSPGAKAGLRSGDVILRINDHSISSPEDVLDASFFIAADDEVKIEVARGEEKLEFQVVAVGNPQRARVRQETFQRSLRARQTIFAVVRCDSTKVAS
jgi:putative serine protease PepD